MSTVFHQRVCALLISLSLLSLISCGGGGSDGGQEQVSQHTSSSLSLDSVSDEVGNTITTPFNTGVAVTSPFQAVQMASANTTITPYTPAQIRSAYQLPAYPSSWTNLTPLQAAQMGAGQTIYIIDAYHDPSVVAELDAFNKAFGLPPCQFVSIDPNTALPLQAADKSGCQLSQVYASQAGMTAASPAYSKDWAGEIALDVQWAHATAPLARIVLVEAADNTLLRLMEAINLANTLGPGVVSMSFGATENSWTATLDSAFSASDMTYVAATGDNGAAVNWPAVSSKVLAVGGTSLSSFQNTSRTETAWSKTGGGPSLYVAVPDYQKTAIPNSAFRSVADVAFNADPNTGQYVVTMAPSSNVLTWNRYGGTSIAAPQWAGVVAVTNAVRSLNGNGPIGLVQQVIYQAAATASDFFSSVMNDITTGSNGFGAGNKYDIPTGLGTPNVSAFITLAGGQTPTSGSGSAPISSDTTPTPPAAVAPVVSNITVTGFVDSPLTFSLSYTSSNPVTWMIPYPLPGMTIDADSGLISLSRPAMVGVFNIDVIAVDKVNQTKGVGVATVNIKSNKTIVLDEAVFISTKVGQPFSYQLKTFPNSNGKLVYSLDSNAPSGLVIDATQAVLSWNSPQVGDYSFNVILTIADNQFSLKEKVHLVVTDSIPSAGGPVITASDIQGQVGRPLMGFIRITNPSAKRTRVEISGAPAGLSYAPSGPGILLRWRNPVAGNYSLVVTATDSNYQSSQQTIRLTVN